MARTAATRVLAICIMSVAFLLGNGVFWLYHVYFLNTLEISIWSIVVQCLTYSCVVLPVWIPYHYYNGKKTEYQPTVLHQPFTVFLISVFLMPLLEEVVFRYLIPYHLMWFVSGDYANIVSSIMFGLIHVTNGRLINKSMWDRPWSTWVLSLAHITSLVGWGWIISQRCKSLFVLGVLVHYWCNWIILTVAFIVDGIPLLCYQNTTVMVDHKKHDIVETRIMSHTICIPPRDGSSLSHASAPHPLIQERFHLPRLTLSRAYSVPHHLLMVSITDDSFHRDILTNKRVPCPTPPLLKFTSSKLSFPQ